MLRARTAGRSVGWLGTRRVRWIYVSLALALGAYLVSLVVRGGPSNAFFDGWFTAAVELVAASMCLARGITRRHNRAMPFLLASALFAWTIGDAVLTIESTSGDVATPSLADAFYLSFYPVMYAVLFMLIRRERGRVLPGSWLDGAVAGFGAAAVCATFLFGSLEHSLGGSATAVATSLAYPVGDLVLLVLAVGGSAVLGGSTTATWRLLALACAVNAVGDTFNLVDSAGYSAFGSIVDGIAWPASIFFMSLAVWLRTNPRDYVRPAKAPGFLLPGLGSAAGLAVLFTATLHDVGAIALALGTATLVVAGIRFALSLRGMSLLTEQRRRQSLSDELTGLGNRRMLAQILDSFFAEQADPDAQRQWLAFLFVDLDHFKEINDSFGHAAGDALLRQLGPRLTAALRDSDALVRLGGDELGVVLPETTASDAVLIAERVLDALTKPFNVDGVSVRISASVGVATAPGDAEDHESLLRAADVAMYRAKLSRAGVAVYQSDLDDESNRLLLAEELRLAVERRELTLHFQPQIDLRSGETTAVEALLRWPHPRLGEVPPLQFLPLAEELGLMSALTDLVLDLALEQCAAWHADGNTVRVSVNVSASNLLQDGFIATVQEALRRHGVAASSCILEITETTIIEDFQKCRLVIEQLRALGIAVSIDDFGAGFTSLAYLGSLAVSEVKLDRSFVMGLTDEDRARDRELVRATIELGHALGLRVVAEGIEDPATLDVLTAMGCDVAQGYFMGEPAPADRIDALLASRSAVAS